MPSVVPSAKVLRDSSGFSLPSGSYTAVPMQGLSTNGWDTPIDDLYPMWSALNPARLTIQTPGLYKCGGQLRFPVVSSCWLGGGIYQVHGPNSSVPDHYLEEKEFHQANNARNVKLSFDTLGRFEWNDYLELHAYQSSGSSVTLPAGYQWIWAARVDVDVDPYLQGSQGGVGGRSSSLPLLPSSASGAQAVVSADVPLPLLFDSSVGQWVSPPYRAFVPPGLAVGTTSYVEYAEARKMPWSPYAAAGLIPQVRITGKLYGTAPGNTAYARLAYTGISALGDRVSVLPLATTEVSVTGNTNAATGGTPVDSGWQDIVDVATAYILLIVQIKASSAGVANFNELAAHIRWKTNRYSGIAGAP